MLHFLFAVLQHLCLHRYMNIAASLFVILTVIATKITAGAATRGACAAA